MFTIKLGPQSYGMQKNKHGREKFKVQKCIKQQEIL
jgi:hypothetical protein